MLKEVVTQEVVTLRGCLLCDIHDEHGEWFGWVHDRANWAVPHLRPAMGHAHALVLAEGGSLRDGPWVPWRDTARDDGEYEDTDGGGSVNTLADGVSVPMETDIFRRSRGSRTDVSRPRASRSR